MILDKNKIYVWHGGKKLDSHPEIRQHKEGKYEAGPGFYTTTKYSTAFKYAKGGGATFLMEISSNIKLANDVNLSVDDTIDFLKNCSGMKNKNKLVEDINEYYERNKKFPANVFINLVVNWRVGAGKIGISIAAFLAANGVDASIERQSSTEDWLVIYNPKIIKSFQKILAKNVTDDLYILPKIYK